MDSDYIRGAAANSALWSLADKWGVRIATFATFAVLGRLLEPAEFGLIAAAQVVVFFLQSASNQGVIKALVVAERRDERYLRTATAVAVMIGILSASAVAAASRPLASLFGQEGFAGVVNALAIVLVINSLGSVPTAVLQRRLEFKRLAQRSVASSLIGGAVGIVTALAEWGAWALVAQSISQAVVATTLAWFASRLRPGLAWDRRGARTILAFATPVALADVLTVVLSNGDNFVVGAVLGTVALGYYAIAFRLQTVVVEAFVGVMSAVALPIFKLALSEPDMARRAYLRATQFSFAIATPVLLAFASSATVLVPLAFGTQWDRSVPIFQVLCLAGIASAALFFDRPLLLAARRPYLELGLTSILAATTVGAALIGVQYGLLATATLVTFRIYLTWPLRIFVIKRVIAIRYRDYLSHLWSVALAAAFQIVASAGLLSFLPGTLWGVLTATTCGLLLYSVILWLADRNLMIRGVQLITDARSYKN